MRILRGHTGPVRCLAYSPDGCLVASGSDDKTIKTWDLVQGRERSTLQGHEDWVRAVAFAPDGKTLASGGWDGTVRLWTSTGRSLRSTVVSPSTDFPTRSPSRRDSSGGVWSLCFAPDGLLLTMGCSNGDVKLYWTRDLLAPRCLSGHTWPVNAVLFSPDGRLIASGGHDRTVRLWDGNWGREMSILGEHSD